MVGQLSVFGRYAEVCAARQWEVIIGMVTFTICMLASDERHQVVGPSPSHCQLPREYVGVDAVVMTAIRCVSLLYTYHQFRKLHALGSKYLLGFAGLFIVIATFVFTSSIVNFMHSGVNDLKDALFFFLLLVDLSKVTRLAQYAMTAPSAAHLPSTIGAGMAVLAPQITLDVLLEILLISVGTLSGVYRLEVLCCYACMSAVVSYLMFLTFYPACLSLVLQIARDSDEADWRSLSAVTFSQLLSEDADKTNSLVKKIKVIMLVALTFVHFVSRWPLQQMTGFHDPLDLLRPLQTPVQPGDDGTCKMSTSSSYSILLKWISISAEHLVILIIVVSLVVKYVLFEEPDSANDVSAALPNPSYSSPVSSPVTSVSSPSFPSQSQLESQQKSLCLSGGDSDGESVSGSEEGEAPLRSLAVCQQMMEEGRTSYLSNSELHQLLRHRCLRLHQLEAKLDQPERAVSVRRRYLLEKLVETTSCSSMAAVAGSCLHQLPYAGYEYDRVLNTCCENVIGFMPVPVGVVGPLSLNGERIYVPLATTEGALVASTNRGCVALGHAGGISSYVIGDGMTRAPVIECPSARIASEVVAWLKVSDNFQLIKSEFDSTSRFARLSDVQTSMFGRQLFMRFVAATGDAMGMNMVSKGTERAVEKLKQFFPDIVVTSVSSNVCTDKKPSAINWIRGRGKSVVCEAVVPASVVRSTLKTTTAALVNVGVKKNLIGSAVAASMGGNNAHSANIVTALYIATGQDPAQNVGSSSCMTLLEPCGSGDQDLYITCTMPCLEVGTVGGGTVLSAQRACLKMLGCQGANMENPGDNARRLASIVCATVMAGELSLLAAQSAGHLVKSHMALNRSAVAKSRVDDSKRSSGETQTNFNKDDDKTT